MFWFFRFKFLGFRFRVVVENFMDIVNNLERVGTVQMRYQKHYENDTDELKRYVFFFFNKSKSKCREAEHVEP